MYTVGQVAKAVGISDSAVRQWADEYAAHLSDGANPPKGETRKFDEEDIAVLQTVSVLREQLVGHEQIHERLDEGERLEPAPGERPAVDEADEADEAQDQRAGGSDTALVTEQFAEALRRQDSRLQSLTDRLIEAEKRAAAAETRADMLQAQVDELRAAEGKGRPWWAFWR